MATYQNLVDDLRGLHPGLSRAHLTDKVAARAIWRAIVDLVTEAADLGVDDDQRMPTATSTPSVPADKTSGISLPASTSMIKLIRVELDYANGSKAYVRIVPASAKLDRVRPLPAAYIDGDTLYPIPGDGVGMWTDARMEDAEWSNVSTCTVHYVELPTEVTALGDTVPVDAAWHRAAIYRAGMDVALGHAPEALGLFQGRYTEVYGQLMTSLVKPPMGEPEVVRSVWE